MVANVRIDILSPKLMCNANLLTNSCLHVDPQFSKTYPGILDFHDVTIVPQLTITCSNQSQRSVQSQR